MVGMVRNPPAQVDSVLDRCLNSASTLPEILTTAVAPHRLPAHMSEELIDLRNEVLALQAFCVDAERGLATQLRTKAESDCVRANEEVYAMNDSNGTRREENETLVSCIRNQDFAIARQAAA
ncbi:hypothetical protein PHMEG_00028228 [Phytophthora megakarya]|uniref:Uncharacterized protein n=1 Tax=Phytophthora megakarya TaxID=4795 RepID=A0A225V509_9STRA|nr:hypothetical protein PHMEG_00028228 [Phytophthora megakarya]